MGTSDWLQHYLKRPIAEQSEDEGIKGWATIEVNGEPRVIFIGMSISHGGRTFRKYDDRGVTFLVEKGSKVQGVELSRMLSNIPTEARVKGVEISARVGPNPKDEYWAKEYSMPGFKSLATGGYSDLDSKDARGYSIRFWNSEDSGWANQATGPLGARSTAHELGHIYAHKTSKDYAPASFSSAIRGENPVSHYAKSSAAEDFAESFRMYFFDKGELKQKSPAHFAYFDTEFGK